MTEYSGIVVRQRLACSVVLLVGAVSGCAEYRIAFDCGPRINTGLQPEGAPLNVDLAMVTEDDLERFPKLPAMSAAEWFEYRRNNHGATLLPARQVRSVRELRGSDLQNDVRQVKVRHADPLSEGACIIVFGDFARGGEIATHHCIIRPLTWEGHDYVIRVGQNRLDWMEGKYEGEKPVIRE